MTAALRCGDPLDPVAFADVRRAAIFECCKWDPQVGDVASLSRFPLLVPAETVAELSRLAESLAREIHEAERELASRPDLWRELGVPWRVRRALRHIRRDGPPAEIARLVRFDFHLTREGWRVSEANTDVPGGFIEAEGVTRLVATKVGGAAVSGRPASAYADAVSRSVPRGAAVALVHATAYSDDRQVMVYVARELGHRGVRAVLASPEHLRWDHGRASFACDFAEGPLDAVLRFFPAEWLPNCSRASGWRSFFAGAVTPLGNPGTALLTQSKRLPVVWNELRTRFDAWRALLPETRSPRDLRGDPGPEWIVKPALGRVGDGVGISGVTPERERLKFVKWARRRPREWIVQRKFESVPIDSAGGPVHVCLGVYTVDGKAAGIYGRIARAALIDAAAQDAAVLVETPVPAEEVLA